MILSLTLALVLTLSNEFIRCSPTGNFPIFSTVILASDCVLLISRLTSDYYYLGSLLANFTNISEPAKNTSFDSTESLVFGPMILISASALAPPTNPVNVVTSSDPNPTVEIPPKADPANSRSPELPSITIKPSTLDPLQHSTKDVGHKSREDFKSASMSTANSEDFDIKYPKNQSAQNKPGGANHATVDPSSILNSLGSHSQQAAPGIGALIFSAFGASSVPNPSVKSSSGNTIGSFKLDSLRSGLEENPSVVPLDGSTSTSNIPSRYAAGTSIVMGNLVEDPIRSSELFRLSVSGNGHFTFAGQVFVTHHSAVLVDGTTIKPDGIGITKSGTLISLDSDGNLVVDTSTIQVANFARKTIDDQLFNKIPFLLAVDSRTITPGGSGITVSGTPVRLDSNGNLIIDKSTVEHANIFPTPLSSKYPINDQLFTGNPPVLSMKGEILTAGEAGITISGTPIRIDPDGNLIVDMSTIEIAKISPTPPPSIYTIYNQLFTGNPSFLSIKGKIIRAGGAGITISGTPIRLDPDGNLIVDTSTVNLAKNIPTPSPSTYNIDGQFFSGNSSILTIDGKTITAGGAGITISGTPVLLKSSGILRFGTKEIPLPTNGRSNSVNGSGAPKPFFGGQERVQISRNKMIFSGSLIAVEILAGIYGFG